MWSLITSFSLRSGLIRLCVGEARDIYSTYLASSMTTELSTQLSPGSCHTIMQPISSQLANWPWELVVKSEMGAVCPSSCREMVMSEPCAGTLSINMGPSDVPVDYIFGVGGVSVFVSVCIYACKHGCDMCVCVCVCMCVCVCVYVCACVCVCVHMCVCVCVCVWWEWAMIVCVQKINTCIVQLSSPGVRWLQIQHSLCQLV